jgi:4'-phosphopantetheinyl transferase
VEEAASIQKYYFVKDAKLALGSALLKRHAISSMVVGVRFRDATPTRAPSTKPVFLLEDASEPLIFNVSHQAGLVVLLAVYRPPGGVSIGVDVVCPAERRERDHSLIAREGWSSFVDMHDSVFAPAECVRLRELGLAREALLEHFYALWCLREGYVKMTGEALLAEWLAELEMRHFAPPGQSAGRELEVWFRGARVDDGLHVKLERFLDDYMVCTVVRGNVGGVDLDGGFDLLDLESMLDAAEESNRAV